MGKRLASILVLLALLIQGASAGPWISAGIGGGVSWMVETGQWRDSWRRLPGPEGDFSLSFGWDFPQDFSLSGGVRWASKGAWNRHQSQTDGRITNDGLYFHHFLEFPVTATVSFPITETFSVTAGGGVWFAWWVLKTQALGSVTHSTSLKPSGTIDFTGQDKRFAFGLEGSLGLEWEVSGSFDVFCSLLLKAQLTSMVKEVQLNTTHRRMMLAIITAGVQYNFGRGEK